MILIVTFRAVIKDKNSKKQHVRSWKCRNFSAFLFSSLLLIFYSVLLHLASVLGNKMFPCPAALSLFILDLMTPLGNGTHRSPFPSILLKYFPMTLLKKELAGDLAGRDVLLVICLSLSSFSEKCCHMCLLESCAEIFCSCEIHFTNHWCL